MIYDRIENLSIMPLPTPARKKIAAFIRGAAALPEGKHEIDGSKIYASIQNITTKSLEEAKFEAHRRYADIQIVMEGAEQIGVTLFEDLEIRTPYNEPKDVELYEPKTPEYSEVAMRPGYFVLLMPSDIHMPCLAVKDPQPVKKMVIKVAIELFD